MQIIIYGIRGDNYKLDSLKSNIIFNNLNNVIIQTDYIYQPNHEVTSTEIIFPKPFPNACVFISFTDDTDIGYDSIRKLGIDTKFLSKTGCTVNHSKAINKFFYMALGY